MRTAMLGGAGYAIGERLRSGPPPFAPGAQESSGAASQANRIDALTKLKSLLDLGVLTQEQHDAERGRLLEGPGISRGQIELGPVQLLVIAVAGETCEVTILEELHRLRENEATRLLDLLFVTKDDRGQVVQVDHSEFAEVETDQFGGLVSALLGLRSKDAAARQEADPAGAAANGSLLAARNIWFLADAVPTDATAAIALVEHRWAIPLRDAVERTRGHNRFDCWVHPEDLIAIGATVA